MIRAFVVEDEPLPRARLRRLLEAIDGVEVVGEAKTGADALASLPDLGVSVLFLDIQLPDMSGFDVLARLTAAPLPLVVFVTAFDEFAVRAFEIHAVDYLLKPFDAPQLERAMARVKERLARPADVPADSLVDLRALVGELRRQAESLRGGAASPVQEFAQEIAVRARGEIRLVRLAEVDWLGSADNYVEIHSGERVHLARRSLSSLEERLDPRRFVRIHRQTIVNADRVRAFRLDESGELRIELVTGTLLRVGRAFRARVAHRWEGLPGVEPQV